MNGLSREDIVDGGIYRVGLDGTAKRIAVPSDRVMDFYLTENNIYYTLYDKKEYGESPRGGQCVRYDGDKIYRVDRKSAESAEYGDGTDIPVETVFDGNDTLFAANWLPIDGYIYISAAKLMDEGDMNWFRVIGETARVNRENGTIKWLSEK